MKTRLTLLTGGAIGYVLGTKAGRHRYEQIKQVASRVAAKPQVQQARQAAATRAARLADSARVGVGDKVSDAVQEGHYRVADRLGDKMPERMRPRTYGTPMDTTTPVGMLPIPGTAATTSVAGTTNGVPSTY